MAYSPMIELEIHVRQDIPGNIDTGGDLDQCQAPPYPAEHASLGDVIDRLAAVISILPVEGDLPDLFQELPLLSFFEDAEFAVLHRHFEAIAGKGACEHDKPRSRWPPPRRRKDERAR